MFIDSPPKRPDPPEGAQRPHTAGIPAQTPSAVPRRFGDAGFFGSTGAINLNKPIVGMAATPSGKGYWLVASDGGIFSFGDVKFFGAAVGSSFPVVGMAAAKDGQGYSIVRADGTVVNRGSAPAAGSLVGQLPSKPIVGIAATV